MKQPNDYLTHHYRSFEEFEAMGYISIDIAPELIGKPWDEVALGYLHAYRPSGIRVTKDSITLDAMLWRITVVIDENNIIKSIDQEVQVGLPEGVTCGSAFNLAMKYGLESEQVKWYNDDTITGFIHDSINGVYYKDCAEGKVPFPVPEEQSE